MFKDLTITQYNEILASKAPTPGGGSGLAVVGSTAVAMCQMAINVTLTKGEREELLPALATLTRCADKLLQLADDDSTAFNKIIATSRLVRNGEAEKSALQKEYHRSALVPIEVMQVCQKAIHSTEMVMPFLYKYVASDAVIGVDLLKCVVKNSLHNVYANTCLIVDDHLRANLEKQAESIVGEIK